MKRYMIFILSLSFVLLVNLTSAGLFAQDNSPIDAPDFVLTDLDGNTISLSDLEGNVIFLNFWATWCTPCKKEFPYFNDAYETHKDNGVKIVGISIDRSEKIVKKFLQKTELVFPIAMGKRKFLSDYGVGRAVPVTIIIDKKGKLRHKLIGGLEKEDLEKYIQELVNEGQG